MTDIIDRLRAHGRLVAGPTNWEAADEIERLRAAGDALAAGIRSGQWDDALDEWEKIRNG